MNSPQATADIEDPRRLWQEEQAYTLLLTATLLIILFHPLFHFILVQAPSVRHDSLVNRLLATIATVLITALVRIFRLQYKYSSYAITLICYLVLSSTLILVADSNYNPLYAAASVFPLIGMQMFFVRFTHLMACTLLAQITHFFYAIIYHKITAIEDYICISVILSSALISLLIGFLRIRLTDQLHESKLQVIKASTELEKVNEFLRYEKARAESLLLNILPRPIADRLQRRHEVIADYHGEVSVMFADIVGFTKIAADRSPTDIVHILNKLFTTFDQLASQHGIEKIKTIGDAYMAASGVPMPRPDHAQALGTMALQMIQVVDEFSKANQIDISIRIGLNAGPIVAGVIGTQKFIYDLWGDTVNIASRMESHGIAGSIHVTEVFYNSTKKDFQYLDRGEIEVKGKGKMRTYILQSAVIAPFVSDPH